MIRLASITDRRRWALVSASDAVYSLAQDRPGGCAVAVFHLERQADQLVLTRLYLRQIQAFDDPDTGAEKRLVSFDAVFPEPTYRKVVDADGPDPAIRYVTGRLLGDVHEVFDEVFGPPVPGRVLRLEQDPLAATNFVRV